MMALGGLRFRDGVLEMGLPPLKTVSSRTCAAKG